MIKPSHYQTPRSLDECVFYTSHDPIIKLLPSNHPAMKPKQGFFARLFGRKAK